ncbi:hypothetical protein BZK37_06760 [Enterococcus casseliflavus]|nr:hypothetical protein BZK37_06760 [Enterococcus casseliflavus]
MSTIYLKDLHEINTKLIPELLSSGNKGLVYANGNTLSCKEFNSVQLVIKNPFNIGLFYNSEKMMEALSEMIFALSGRSDSLFMEIFSEELNLNSDDYGFFTTPIGKRIYELHGNQIYNAYNKLNENIYSTQAIMNLFMNYPTYIGQDCTMTAQFLADNTGTLNCYLNYRSIDVISYLKTDAYIYSTILYIITLWLGLDPRGRLIINTPKLFILDNHQEYAKEIINQPKVFTAEIANTEIKNILSHRNKFNLAIEIFLEGYRNKNYENLINCCELPDFIKEIMLVLAFHTDLDKTLTIEKVKNNCKDNNPYIKNWEFFDDK